MHRLNTINGHRASSWATRPSATSLLGAASRSAFFPAKGITYMHGSDFYYIVDTSAVATSAIELSMVQQALWSALRPHLGEGMPQPSHSKNKTEVPVLSACANYAALTDLLGHGDLHLTCSNGVSFLVPITRRLRRMPYDATALLFRQVPSELSVEAFPRMVLEHAGYTVVEPSTQATGLPSRPPPGSVILLQAQLGKTNFSMPDAGTIRVLVLAPECDRFLQLLPPRLILDGLPLDIFTLVSDDPFPKVPRASMARPYTVPFLPEHIDFGIFRDEEQEDVVMEDTELAGAGGATAMETSAAGGTAAAAAEASAGIRAAETGAGMRAAAAAAGGEAAVAGGVGVGVVTATTSFSATVFAAATSPGTVATGAAVRAATAAADGAAAATTVVAGGVITTAAGVSATASPPKAAAARPGAAALGAAVRAATAVAGGEAASATVVAGRIVTAAVGVSSTVSPTKAAAAIPRATAPGAAVRATTAAAGGETAVAAGVGVGVVTAAARVSFTVSPPDAASARTGAATTGAAVTAVTAAAGGEAAAATVVAGGVITAAAGVSATGFLERGPLETAEFSAGPHRRL